MGESYQGIELLVDPPLALLRLNRPERRNALDARLRAELLHALEELSHTPSVRALLLSARGPAFCAGGDLEELSVPRSLEGARAYVEEVGLVIRALWSHPKPVIAAVEGPAFGAGFSIVMACDLVVASETARFSQAFGRVGLLPDLGSAYFLPRLVGMQRAKEWIFTGREIRAQELERLGLVNRLVAAGKAEEEGRMLAGEMARAAPLALASGKRLLHQAWEVGLEEVLKKEAVAQAACIVSEDHREGIAAFREKRTPHFRGR